VIIAADSSARNQHFLHRANEKVPVRRLAELGAGACPCLLKRRRAAADLGDRNNKDAKRQDRDHIVVK